MFKNIMQTSTTLETFSGFFERRIVRCSMLATEPSLTKLGQHGRKTFGCIALVLTDSRIIDD